MRKKSKVVIETTYTPAGLKKDILREARSIGMAEGFATAVADQVAKEISAWLDGKTTVTSRSLDRKVASIIKKYHSDLAYLYENRGKII